MKRGAFKKGHKPSGDLFVLGSKTLSDKNVVNIPIASQIVALNVPKSLSSFEFKTREIHTNDFYSRVLKALDASNKELCNQLILSSIKLLKNTTVINALAANTKNDKNNIYLLSLLLIAKKHAFAIQHKESTEALCSLLHRDVFLSNPLNVTSVPGGGSFASTSGQHLQIKTRLAYFTQLAPYICNVLYTAYQEEEDWPEIFIKIYIDDAMHERFWVDNFECQNFVDNIKSAFNTRVPFVPKPLAVQDRNIILPRYITLLDNIHLYVLQTCLQHTIINTGSSAQMSFSVPNTSSNQNLMQQYGLQNQNKHLLIQEPIENFQFLPPTGPENTNKTFLRFLSQVCCYPKIRLFIMQRIEIWLQNAKLINNIIDLLFITCYNIDNSSFQQSNNKSNNDEYSQQIETVVSDQECVRIFLRLTKFFQHITTNVNTNFGSNFANNLSNLKASLNATTAVTITTLPYNNLSPYIDALIVSNLDEVWSAIKSPMLVDGILPASPHYNLEYVKTDLLKCLVREILNQSQTSMSTHLFYILLHVLNVNPDLAYEALADAMISYMITQISCYDSSSSSITLDNLTVVSNVSVEDKNITPQTAIIDTINNPKMTDMTFHLTQNQNERLTWCKIVYREIVLRSKHFFPMNTACNPIYMSSNTTSSKSSSSTKSFPFQGTILFHGLPYSLSYSWDVTKFASIFLDKAQTIYEFSENLSNKNAQTQDMNVELEEMPSVLMNKGNSIYNTIDRSKLSQFSRSIYAKMIFHTVICDFLSSNSLYCFTPLVRDAILHELWQTKLSANSTIVNTSGICEFKSVYTQLQIKLLHFTINNIKRLEKQQCLEIEMQEKNQFLPTFMEHHSQTTVNISNPTNGILIHSVLMESLSKILNISDSYLSHLIKESGLLSLALIDKSSQQENSMENLSYGPSVLHVVLDQGLHSSSLHQSHAHNLASSTISSSGQIISSNPHHISSHLATWLKSFHIQCFSRQSAFQLPNLMPLINELFQNYPEHIMLHIKYMYMTHNHNMLNNIKCNETMLRNNQTLGNMKTVGGKKKLNLNTNTITDIIMQEFNITPIQEYSTGQENGLNENKSFSLLQTYRSCIQDLIGIIGQFIYRVCLPIRLNALYHQGYNGVGLDKKFVSPQNVNWKDALKFLQTPFSLELKADNWIDSNPPQSIQDSFIEFMAKCIRLTYIPLYHINRSYTDLLFYEKIQAASENCILFENAYWSICGLCLMLIVAFPLDIGHIIWTKPIKLPLNTSADSMESDDETSIKLPKTVQSICADLRILIEFSITNQDPNSNLLLTKEKSIHALKTSLNNDILRVIECVKNILSLDTFHDKYNILENIEQQPFETNALSSNNKTNISVKATASITHKRKKAAKHTIEEETPKDESLVWVNQNLWLHALIFETSCWLDNILNVNNGINQNDTNGILALISNISDDISKSYWSLCIDTKNHELYNDVEESVKNSSSNRKGVVFEIDLFRTPYFESKGKNSLNTIIMMESKQTFTSKCLLDNFRMLNTYLKLGFKLCACREPDFLLDLIGKLEKNQIQTSSDLKDGSLKHNSTIYNWLTKLIESTHYDIINVLPNNCLSQYLISRITPIFANNDLTLTYMKLHPTLTPLNSCVLNETKGYNLQGITSDKLLFTSELEFYKQIARQILLSHMDGLKITPEDDNITEHYSKENHFNDQLKEWKERSNPIFGRIVTVMTKLNESLHQDESKTGLITLYNQIEVKTNDGEQLASKSFSTITFKFLALITCFNEFRTNVCLMLGAQPTFLSFLFGATTSGCSFSSQLKDNFDNNVNKEHGQNSVIDSDDLMVDSGKTSDNMEYLINLFLSTPTKNGLSNTDSTPFHKPKTEMENEDTMLQQFINQLCSHVYNRAPLKWIEGTGSDATAIHKTFLLAISHSVCYNECDPLIIRAYLISFVAFLQSSMFCTIETPNINDNKDINSYSVESFCIIYNTLSYFINHRTSLLVKLILLDKSTHVTINESEEYFGLLLAKLLVITIQLSLKFQIEITSNPNSLMEKLLDTTKNHLNMELNSDERIYEIFNKQFLPPNFGLRLPQAFVRAHVSFILLMCHGGYFNGRSKSSEEMEHLAKFWFGSNFNALFSNDDDDDPMIDNSLYISQDLTIKLIQNVPTKQQMLEKIDCNLFEFLPEKLWMYILSAEENDTQSNHALIKMLIFSLKHIIPNNYDRIMKYMDLLTLSNITENSKKFIAQNLNDSMLSIDESHIPEFTSYLSNEFNYKISLLQRIEDIIKHNIIGDIHLNSLKALLSVIEGIIKGNYSDSTIQPDLNEFPTTDINFSIFNSLVANSALTPEYLAEIRLHMEHIITDTQIFEKSSPPKDKTYRLIVDLNAIYAILQDILFSKNINTILTMINQDFWELCLKFGDHYKTHLQPCEIFSVIKETINKIFNSVSQLFNLQISLSNHDRYSQKFINDFKTQILQIYPNIKITSTQSETLSETEVELQKITNDSNLASYRMLCDILNPNNFTLITEKRLNAIYVAKIDALTSAVDGNNSFPRTFNDNTDEYLALLQCLQKLIIYQTQGVETQYATKLMIDWIFASMYAVSSEIVEIYADIFFGIFEGIDTSFQYCGIEFLCHEGDWNTIAMVINHLLCHFSSKYQAKLVLDFLQAILELPRLWEGRDMRNRKKFANESILCLNGHQLKGLIAYILQEYNHLIATEKLEKFSLTIVQNLIKERISKLLIPCMTQSKQSDLLYYFVRQILPELYENHYLTLLERNGIKLLIYELYIHVPHILKIFDESKKLYTNITIKEIPFHKNFNDFITFNYPINDIVGKENANKNSSHDLILFSYQKTTQNSLSDLIEKIIHYGLEYNLMNIAKANETYNTSYNREKPNVEIYEQDSERCKAFCLALARNHPYILVRHLKSIHTILRGRTHLQYSAFVNKGHFSIFTVMITLVYNLQPYILTHTDSTTDFHAILDEFLEFIDIYGQQTYKLMSNVKRVITLLQNYVKANKKMGLSYLKQRLDLIRNVQNYYGDLFQTPFWHAVLITLENNNKISSDEKTMSDAINESPITLITKNSLNVSTDEQLQTLIDKLLQILPKDDLQSFSYSTSNYNKCLIDPSYDLYETLVEIQSHIKSHPKSFITFTKYLSKISTVLFSDNNNKHTTEKQLNVSFTYASKIISKCLLPMCLKHPLHINSCEDFMSPLLIKQAEKELYDFFTKGLDSLHYSHYFLENLSQMCNLLPGHYEELISTAFKSNIKFNFKQSQAIIETLRSQKG